MEFFQNACKPKGWGGKVMLNMMNKGHEALSKWGFSHIDIKSYVGALDIGCGGGVNIRKMLIENPKIHVRGIDYSEISVQKTKAVNLKYIKEGRCEVKQGNVEKLPYEDSSFDLVTAFETIYFWPELGESFSEVHRVLSKGGRFLICNEANGEIEEHEKWPNIISGMRIYNSEELENLLESAGFSKIDIDKTDKGWICVVAQK